MIIVLFKLLAYRLRQHILINHNMACRWTILQGKHHLLPVHVGLVKQVHETVQTSQMGQLTDPTDALVVSLPIASTPCSAAPSRINELTNSVPPLLSQKSGSPHEIIFENVYEKFFGACTGEFEW